MTKAPIESVSACPALVLGFGRYPFVPLKDIIRRDPEYIMSLLTSEDTLDNLSEVKIKVLQRQVKIAAKEEIEYTQQRLEVLKKLVSTVTSSVP